MKIFYPFLICLGLAMPLAAQGETCPPTGVTTNPDAPVNDLHPFHRNEYFGWRDYRCDVQLDQNENIREMTNPNEYAGGVYHLAEMNKIFLEKVEELTLRVIELEKKIK